MAGQLWNEFPGFPRVGASLAAIAIRNGHPERAINILDTSLEAVRARRWNTLPIDEGYLLQIKAEVFKMMHYCDQAMPLYRMAAQVDPDLAVAEKQTPPTCP